MLILATDGSCAPSGNGRLLSAAATSVSASFMSVPNSNSIWSDDAF